MASSLQSRAIINHIMDEDSGEEFNEYDLNDSFDKFVNQNRGFKSIDDFLGSPNTNFANRNYKSIAREVLERNTLKTRATPTQKRSYVQESESSDSEIETIEIVSPSKDIGTPKIPPKRPSQTQKVGIVRGKPPSPLSKPNQHNKVNTVKLNNSILIDAIGGQNDKRYNYDRNRNYKSVNPPRPDISDADTDEDTFTCEICDTSYDLENGLIRHQIRAHNGNQWRCKWCRSDLKFSRGKNKYEHECYDPEYVRRFGKVDKKEGKGPNVKDSSTPNRSPKAIKVDSKKVVNTVQSKRELLTSTPIPKQTKIECDICEYSFPSLEKLTKHKERAHRGNPLLKKVQEKTAEDKFAEDLLSIIEDPLSIDEPSPQKTITVPPKQGSKLPYTPRESEGSDDPLRIEKKVEKFGDELTNIRKAAEKDSSCVDISDSSKSDAATTNQCICEICNNSYDKEYYLTKHQARAHRGNQWKCKQCISELKFSTGSDKYEHQCDKKTDTDVINNSDRIKDGEDNDKSKSKIEDSANDIVQESTRTKRAATENNGSLKEPSSKKKLRQGDQLNEKDNDNTGDVEKKRKGKEKRAARGKDIVEVYDATETKSNRKGKSSDDEYDPKSSKKDEKKMMLKKKLRQLEKLKEKQEKNENSNEVQSSKKRPKKRKLDRDPLTDYDEDEPKHSSKKLKRKKETDQTPDNKTLKKKKDKYASSESENNVESKDGIKKGPKFRFKCPECGIRSPNFMSLLNHSSMAHYRVQLMQEFVDDAREECKECNEKFPAKALYQYGCHYGSTHEKIYKFMKPNMIKSYKSSKEKAEEEILIAEKEAASNANDDLEVIKEESTPITYSNQLLKYLLSLFQEKDKEKFFAKPVTKEVAPDYENYVKNPMDFSTMNGKINLDMYSTLNEFKLDVELICNNAVSYNESHSIFAKKANVILTYCKNILSEDKIRSLKRKLPYLTNIAKEFLEFDVNAPRSNKVDTNTKPETKETEIEIDGICIVEKAPVTNQAPAVLNYTEVKSDQKQSHPNALYPNNNNLVNNPDVLNTPRIKDTKKDEADAESATPKQTDSTIELGSSPISPRKEDPNPDDGIETASSEARIPSDPNLIKLMKHILPLLKQRDRDRFFAEPVTEKIAPDYFQIVKRPMDFSTMEKKLDKTPYLTFPEFVSDFEQICKNAMLYNRSNTVYYKRASELRNYGLQLTGRKHLRSLKEKLTYLAEISEEALGFDINFVKEKEKPKEKGYKKSKQFVANENTAPKDEPPQKPTTSKEEQEMSEYETIRRKNILQRMEMLKSMGMTQSALDLAKEMNLDESGKPLEPQKGSFGRQLNVYECKSCDHTETSKQKIKHHVYSEHEKRPLLKCEDCKYETYRQKSLNIHNNLEHARSRKYKCRKCGFGARSERALNLHTEICKAGGGGGEDDPDYIPITDDPEELYRERRKQAQEEGKAPLRRNRCGTCIGCTMKDCRKCWACKDKTKYGGPGKQKQACIYKKCEVVTLVREENDPAWNKKAYQGSRGAYNERIAMKMEERKKKEEEKYGVRSRSSSKARSVEPEEKPQKPSKKSKESDSSSETESEVEKVLPIYKSPKKIPSKEPNNNIMSTESKEIVGLCIKNLIFRIVDKSFEKLWGLKKKEEEKQQNKSQDTMSEYEKLRERNIAARKKLLESMNKSKK